jgi:hypothetical protein
MPPICKVCSRPLLSEKSIKDGMGAECKRQLKLEALMENQLMLRLGKEIPKELNVKKGICTKLRYKGNEYALVPIGSGG